MAERFVVDRSARESRPATAALLADEGPDHLGDHATLDPDPREHVLEGRWHGTGASLP